MHVITVNLLLFLFFVVLPLLSFLRHNRAFRGGAQEMVKLSKRQKERQNSPETAGTHRKRAVKRMLMRMTFALVLAAPINYVVFTNLGRLAAHGGHPEQICACQHWLHDVAPWLPRLFTFALASPHGSVQPCVTHLGVVVLAGVLRSLPAVFLVLAVVIDVGYVFLFYTDGREYGMQTRHNDSRLNRFINDIKFRYCLPYVNWKCRLVRNYFSAELIASDGPLPLFRYPTRDNLLRRSAASHASSIEEVRAASSSTAAAVDDWDEDERAALAAQAQQAGTRSHLPLNQWAAWRSAEAAATPGTGPAQGRVVDADGATPEAAMESTRYLFAAHPHGILPLGALVGLVSNVTDRNRVLFVDNRHLTSTTPPPEPTASPAAVWRDVHRSPSRSPVSSALASHKFTTTHTRYLSPATATAAAVLSLEHSPHISPVPQAATSSPAQAGKPSTSPAPVPFSSLPPPASTTTTTLAPSSPASPSPPPSPPPPTAAASTVDEAHPVMRRPYARGRYYAYDKALCTFRLIPGRDEAVPLAGLRPPSSSTKFGDRVRIRLRAVVATFPFFIPIMRESYLFHGMLDASYASCRRVLQSNLTPVVQKMWSWRPHRRHHPADEAPEGATAEEPPTSPAAAPRGAPTVMDYNGLLIFPGGASEALLSSHKGPARLLLRRRKGFVRLALQTGASLVPCYTFGETDYYDQWGTQSWRGAAEYEDDDSTVWGRAEESETANPEAASGSRSSVAEESDSDSGLAPPQQKQQQQQQQQQEQQKQAQAQPRRPTQDATPSDEEHSPRSSSSGLSSSSSTSGAARDPGAARRTRRQPPRWLQWIQRCFQDTFGISLPLVKNVIPHRCKIATVVGRPLYFELPDDVTRMYAEPDKFYDAEVERAVVAAAQSVYIRELQELFNKYAPVYLADPRRRRLIVV